MQNLLGFWPQKCRHTMTIPSNNFLKTIYFSLNIAKNTYIFIIYLAALGLSCSMWDLVPWPETEPGPLHWKHGVLTTGPPGKSSESFSMNELSTLEKMEKIQMFFLSSLWLPVIEVFRDKVVTFWGSPSNSMKPLGTYFYCFGLVQWETWLHREWHQQVSYQ